MVITSYETKTLREDRHGLEENFVAEATRSRRRSELFNTEGVGIYLKGIEI